MVVVRLFVWFLAKHKIQASKRTGFKPHPSKCKTFVRKKDNREKVNAKVMTRRIYLQHLKQCIKSEKAPAN